MLNVPIILFADNRNNHKETLYMYTLYTAIKSTKSVFTRRYNSSLVCSPVLPKARPIRTSLAHWLPNIRPCMITTKLNTNEQSGNDVGWLLYESLLYHPVCTTYATQPRRHGHPLVWSADLQLHQERTRLDNPHLPMGWTGHAPAV